MGKQRAAKDLSRSPAPGEYGHYTSVRQCSISNVIGSGLEQLGEQKIRLRSTENGRTAQLRVAPGKAALRLETFRKRCLLDGIDGQLRRSQEVA
jgi:hypothetical protein